MLRYTCRVRMYTASGEPVEALATAYFACCQVATRGKYRLYTTQGLVGDGEFWAHEAEGLHANAGLVEYTDRFSCRDPVLLMILGWTSGLRTRHPSTLRYCVRSGFHAVVIVQARGTWTFNGHLLGSRGRLGKRCASEWW